MNKYLAVFVACLALVFPAVAFGATGVGDGIVFVEQSSSPFDPEAGEVLLWVDTTGTPVLYMTDDNSTDTALTSTSAVNLDGAYNASTSNIKKITVDDGVFELETAADGIAAFLIDHNDTTNDTTAFQITNAAGGANAISIDIDAQTTGRDIEGTDALWYVSGAGSAYFTTLTAASFTPTTLVVSTTGSFGGNLTLDDGATDSPSLIFTDETGESLTITKTDGDYATFTTASGNGIRTVTGNLSVGDPSSAGTAAMNGEDFFVAGDSEFDGAVQFDGATTHVGTLTAAVVVTTGVVAFSENVTFTMAADEYMLLDAASTAMTGTQGALDINVGTITDGVSGINVIMTALTSGGGGDFISGIYVNIADDTDGASELMAINIDSTDVTGSSNTWGIAFQDTSGGDTLLEQHIHAETSATGQFLVLDCATTDYTGTSGALDLSMDTITSTASLINIDFEMLTGGGADEVAAIVIDLVDSSNAAGEIAGILIDSSTPGGSSRVIGISFTDQTGAATGLTECIAAELPVAGQYLVLDASTVDNTGTEGLIDINFDSAAAAAAAINVKVTHVSGGGGQLVAGIEVEMLSDADNANDETLGLLINATDTTSSGTLTGVLITGSGLDIGIQVDHGGIWIGEGATADQTQGDDTLFVEDTIEVDGIIYADGGIVGAGNTGTTILGMTSVVEDYTGADNVITIAESGSTYTNSGDATGSQHTLPEASTCIGATFTFVVVAAQSMVIELDDADIFIHLAASLHAGDPISSSTPGDTITVRSISSSQWAIISVYPLEGDWADAG